MDLKTWIKATDTIKTARKAAELCNVHYQTIGNLVRGEGKPIALATMNKISAGLGISLDALVAMCTNLNCKGLKQAQDAHEAEKENDADFDVPVQTSSPTAAQIVGDAIPTHAPQTSSPIQAILNRADELENDAE
jgi:plasmid maintenance system antidote protein VapI